MYVYLGLGTNTGDRVGHLRAAIDRLGAVVTIQRESFVYETAPMYITEQPTFLNMVVFGETALTPAALLNAIKAIEATLGRDLSPAATRYGPRSIDIDIELATSVPHPITSDDYITVATPTLTIPHPRLAERAFVLRPLLDVSTALDLIDPRSQVAIVDLARMTQEQGCVLIGALDHTPTLSRTDEENVS